MCPGQDPWLRPLQDSGGGRHRRAEGRGRQVIGKRIKHTEDKYFGPSILFVLCLCKPDELTHVARYGYSMSKSVCLQKYGISFYTIHA